MKQNTSYGLNKTENRLTRISLVIVWMFIFCYIWKLIPTMYEAIEWFADTKQKVGNTLGRFLTFRLIFDVK